MPKSKLPRARTLEPLAHRVRGHVPDANATWVTFDESERELLSRYLSESAIAELAESCSFVGALYHHLRANPIRYADERAHFARVAEAAQQLLECFAPQSRDGLRLRAIVELGSGAERGTANTDELRRLLNLLATGCQRHVVKLPRQMSRHTLEYEVRCVARVVEPCGIKASAAPGSKFTKIVRVSFLAMGIFSDPGRAIRSYITHRDDDPLRW